MNLNKKSRVIIDDLEPLVFSSLFVEPGLFYVDTKTRRVYPDTDGTRILSYQGWAFCHVEWAMTDWCAICNTSNPTTYKDAIAMFGVQMANFAAQTENIILQSGLKYPLDKLLNEIEDAYWQAERMGL